MRYLLLALIVWGLLSNRKQFLIAADQWVGTLLPGGRADETLSARAWREAQSGSVAWGRACAGIDALFFWQPGHCRQAWRAEVERRQLHRTYRRTWP